MYLEPGAGIVLVPGMVYHSTHKTVLPRFRRVARSADEEKGAKLEDSRARPWTIHQEEFVHDRTERGCLKIKRLGNWSTMGHEVGDAEEECTYAISVSADSSVASE